MCDEREEKKHRKVLGVRSINFFTVCEDYVRMRTPLYTNGFGGRTPSVTRRKKVVTPLQRSEFETKVTVGCLLKELRETVGWVCRVVQSNKNDRVYISPDFK